MVKIFVGNIPSDCGRRDVIDTFSKYGKVKDCDIIRNFAFIHMENDDDAKEAIEKLNKSDFLGNEITVEESTSRPRNTHKVYVGNLSSSASRRELQKLFEQYGEVTECDIIKDFGFVHMGKEREAENAISELNNTTFAGRKINVEMSRNDRYRRQDRFGNARAYREYYDRWYEYYYGRGGRQGFGQPNYYDYYNRPGNSGYGGYNSRRRSPARRSRYSRSRSPSGSPSRSRSRSPRKRSGGRDDRSRSASRSRSPSQDRGSDRSSNAD